MDGEGQERVIGKTGDPAGPSNEIGPAACVADKGTYIDIPGQITMWKTTNIEKERIFIPQEFHAIFDLTIIWNFAASIFISGISMHLIDLSYNLYYISQLLKFVGFFIIAIFFSFLCVKIWLDSFICLSNSFIPYPILILKLEHFTYRRVGKNPIAWGEIKTIRHLSNKNGLYGAILNLKTERTVPRNIFHEGLYGYFGYKKDSIFISLKSLDASPVKIMRIIDALFAQNTNRKAGDI